MQQTQRTSFYAILREKELYVLLLLGIVYFYRPLFLSETFFFRDLTSFFLVRKHLLEDAIRAGQLPLWNSYLHGGQPYIGDISSTFFYPANLLYLFLPGIKAFNIAIVLHFLGCAVFSYLCARVLGLRPVSSLIAGSIYGFGGYTLSLANVMGLLFAMTYLPLLCLAWHLFLLEQRKRWFLMTVACGVFQVFAAAPEVNVLSFLFLLGWGLGVSYSSVSRFRILVQWGGFLVFVAGLSLVQTLPAWEMMRQASRGEGIVYEAFSLWSLHMKRFPEFVVPGFSGYLDQYPWSVFYWGKHFVDKQYPYILSLYFGWGTVLLVSCSLRKGRETDGVFSLRFRLVLFAVLLGALILSIGRFLPFFHIIYRYFPPIRIFRYPVKFLLAGLFPAALLAAYSADVHFAPRGKNSRDIPAKWFLTGLWAACASLGLFAGVFNRSQNFATQFLESFFGITRYASIARESLQQSFLHSAAVLIVLTLLYQFRRLQPQPWQHVLIAALVIVDLLAAGTRINPSAPEELFTSIPPVVETIRQKIGEHRFFRTEDPPGVSLKRAASRDIFWGERWSVETLGPPRSAFFRIPTIFHEDTDRLTLANIMKLKAIVEALPWEKRLPVLSAGNVGVIMSSDRVVLPGIELIQTVSNRSNTPFYVYRNVTVGERVNIVYNWRMAASEEQVLSAMLAPGYDPRDQVVLQKTDTSNQFSFLARSPSQDAIFIKNTQKDLKKERIECDTIWQSRERRSPHFERLVVTNRCDGYLVFSEPFYPGWNIRIDGKPVEILQANFAFSAVFLPGGTHRIERYYRPKSLVFGGIGTFIFLGSLIFITHKGYLIHRQT